MRPISLSYTPTPLDADGIAPAGTGGTSGVAFVLAAGWISGGYDVGDSMAHTITIAPSASVTGNYSITGTDSDGKAQTETLATNTTSTVTSAKYWLTVTEILAPSGIGSATVTIGWTGVAIGPTIPLNWRQGPPFSVGLAIDITGTINVTVQHAFDNVWTNNAQPSTFTWYPHATLVTKTADSDSNYAYPPTATRMLVNSVSSGGSVVFKIVQGE